MSVYLEENMSSSATRGSLLTSFVIYALMILLTYNVMPYLSILHPIANILHDPVTGTLMMSGVFVVFTVLLTEILLMNFILSYALFLEDGHSLARHFNVGLFGFITGMFMFFSLTGTFVLMGIALFSAFCFVSCLRMLSQRIGCRP